MSANANGFPLGPPPTYGTAQDVNSCCDPQKKDTIESSNITADSVEFEDPPPYKEKESPTHTVNSFQFLFPLITRPWKRFFSVCWRNHWSISAENFGHNMTYYQLNYIWLLLILVAVSLVVWVYIHLCLAFCPLKCPLSSEPWFPDFDYLQDWLCRLKLLCAVDMHYSRFNLCAQRHWMLPHWVVG